MIVDKFRELFSSSSALEENINENIGLFELEIKSKELPNIDQNTLKNILSVVKPYDSYWVSMGIENDDLIRFDSQTDFDSFFSQYSDAIKHFDGESETFILKLNIDKSKGKENRTIYSYKHFLSFWQKIEPINLLNVLRNILQEQQALIFSTIEPEIKSLATGRILLNKELVPEQKISRQILLNENCHFGNAEAYPLTPDAFFLQDRSNEELMEKFDILSSLFSIVYLFDITIIEDNQLVYKLNGYKTLQGRISIDRELIPCNDVYYRIYQWCYSTEGNTTDKLGLVRNLLSIHLSEGQITTVDTGILVSMHSAYKIYLKENMSKYLDLRGKILDELNWISQKSSEIVEKYLSNYQKSIFTFLSFFISVFILRVLSTGEFKKVFTKDATILSFGFLALSVIFLIFSTLTMTSEKKRLERKYSNLKDRFKNLLDDKDIENILRNDREFEYELGFINDRKRTYFWLWVITILILLSALLTASEYVNWSTIIKVFF